MDITPNVNLLKSLRGVRIRYVQLVGEGIDNALDAGADRISVNFAEDEIEFGDNGCGFTRDRMPALFSLGEHGEMSTTQLGRFGIGIKSHAVNAGNLLRVNSVSKDGRVEAEADWLAILRTGQWKVDDPIWSPVAVGTPTGTNITIAGRRTGPAIKAETIAADIARRFYPAIANGCTIEINGSVVEELSEPQMTDIVERHIGLSDDRRAHIRAGILVGDSKLRKVHVSYRHRVIMPESSVGCGSYGGLNRMFARVQLSGRWHLAQYKDDLPDEEERSELEEAVLEALSPILEKCNSASLSARVNELSDIINDRIPSELATARPRRQKDKSETKPRPKKATRPGHVAPEKADAAANGPAQTKRRPQGRLLITFDGIAEEDGIGSFQSGHHVNRVNLSKDDPYIARLVEHRDQDLAAESLLVLALAIFEEGRATEQRDLWRFGLRVAKHLSIQSGVENSASGAA
jgi:hypothetical protein